MNLRTAIITATTAAVLATSGVALAGAASTEAPAPSAAASSPAVSAAVGTPKSAEASNRRPRVRRHRVRDFIRTVLLDTIGIDRATLRSELRSGKTIGEIATAHGVEPSAVIDALVTEATAKLEAAADAGKIKPERAAKIEARLPARFTKLVNEWHPGQHRNATP